MKRKELPTNPGKQRTGVKMKKCGGMGVWEGKSRSQSLWS